MGKTLDARSDIYSLGCLMYETLAGKPPLLGSTPLETMAKQASETPASLGGSSPIALGETIFTALNKEPDKRFQSASELKDALQKAAATIDKVGKIKRKKSTRTSAKRSLIPILTGIVAVISIAAAATMFFLPAIKDYYQKAAARHLSDSWKKHYQAGTALMKQGKFKDAEMQLAPAAQEAESGATNRDNLVSTCENLAQSLSSQHKYEQAKEAWKRTLAYLGWNDSETGYQSRFDYPPKMTYALYSLGLADYETKDYPAAIRHLGAAFFEYHQRHIEDPTLLRNIVIHLVDASMYRNEYDDAIDRIHAIVSDIPMDHELDTLYDRTLAKLKAQPNLAYQARMLTALAEMHQRRGDNKLSLELFDQAIACFTKAKDPIDICSTEASLADELESTQNYSWAEPHRKRSIEMREKLVSPNDLMVVDFKYKLAKDYLNQGKRQQEESELKEVRRLSLHYLKAHTYPAATSQLEQLCVNSTADLAKNLADRNKHQEAEQYYKEVVDFRERHPGDAKFVLAVALSDYAGNLKLLGKYSQARDAAARAMRLFDKTNDPFGTSYVCQYNYACCLARLHDDAAAESTLKQLLAAFDAGKPPRWAEWVGTAAVNEYAILLNAQKRIAEARHLFEQHTPLFRKHWGTKSVGLAMLLKSGGNNLATYGLYKEALPWHKEALAVFLRAPTGSQADRFAYEMDKVAYMQEASVYEYSCGVDCHTTGALEQARSFYERALARLDHPRPRFFSMKLDTGNKLVDVYTKLGQTEKAAKLKASVAKWPKNG
jgi:tetratricopeptide (TPR) repeat protein